MKSPNATTSKTKSETPTARDATTPIQKITTTSSNPPWSPSSPATTPPSNSGSRPTSQLNQNGRNTLTDGSQTPSTEDPSKQPYMPSSPGPTLTTYPSLITSSDPHFPFPSPSPSSNHRLPAQDYYSQWFARVLGWQLTAQSYWYASGDECDLSISF